ncbi:MAG: hypothetical protein IPM33_03500 [Phycisphaerales bacterium]|nr:hypothetical protein [Phycisphaerales bacterium]
MGAHQRLGIGLAAGLMIAASAGGAWAQGTPEPVPPTMPPEAAKPAADPSTDAPLNDPRLDEKPRENTPRPIAPVAPVSPAGPGQGLRDVPSIPGLSLLDYRLPGRRALPEGTFIATSPGSLIRAATGEMIFVPADRGPGSIAPMVLHTTQRVEQLESATMGLDASTTINLTGQVFSYRGRSHLLVTAFSIESAGSTPGRTQASPEQVEAEARERMAEGDERVAALLRDLETTRSTPRALQSVPLANEQPTPAGARAPLAEGTLIVNRRGRLVRMAQEAGRLAFALDNDPDSPGPGMMMLLPCKALEEIERMAAARGDELVFRVSGRTMVYKGRAALLPTLVQVVPPSDLAPLQ